MNHSNLTIQPIYHHQDLPMELLLLADPNIELVQQYYAQGKAWALKANQQIIGVILITHVSEKTIEIKNIAIDINHQKQGLAKYLINHIKNYAKQNNYQHLDIGTGNSSLNQLALYQKCGFRMHRIESDFFIKNYPHPIFENGIQCIDMIYLRFNIKSCS